MIVALAGGFLLSLGCVYAALSWLVPSYLLKPPPDDPDGKPKLTMPPITRGLIAWLVLAVVVILVIGGELIR